MKNHKPDFLQAYRNALVLIDPDIKADILNNLVLDLACQQLFLAGVGVGLLEARRVLQSE